MLTDAFDATVRLRADDQWQPAHLVFARIADAVDDAGLRLDGHADLALRFLAGRAEPEFW